MSAANQLHSLIDELGFAAVEPHKAMGAPKGIPTTVTVLGDDPLALMFGFRIRPDGHEMQPVVDLLRDVKDDRATISFEDGVAWVTLYDLSGFSNTAIRLLVESFADTIAQTDLALQPGCVRCGGVADAQLMYIDGRATRVCPSCVTEAAREQEELEARLNRPSVAATVGLPAVVAFVACGWALLWTLIDLGLEKLRIDVIEINKFSLLLILLLIGGTGYALGHPLGFALRQSIAIRRAPKTMSIVVVIAALFGGEIGYLALKLLRLAGIFDLKLAAGLLPLVLSKYSSFWILLKLGFTGTICYFCAASASERKTVNLDV